jgi:poly(3-hydroxybutyrate) depolymerase
MIYQMFQAQMDRTACARLVAGRTATWLDRIWSGLPRLDTVQRVAAGCEMFARCATTHTRPAYGIQTSACGNRTVAVREEAVNVTPFATLLHFAKEGVEGQPRILVVAPMSGHFATLLRGTVRVLLPDNDVYITDWHNARDVPAEAGAFGMDDCIDHLMRFIEAIGPGSHLLAVCQPAVPVLAAVALMAQAASKAQPRSMTLMAGPVDTRISPTRVNALANKKPIEWFERTLIDVVPHGFRGARRKVYPGFLQLMAFMAMNIERHIKANLDYHENMVQGRREKVDAHRTFYDEYMAVMDLPAEFYLQTVRKVFQAHELPLGRLHWRGQKVDPGAIRRTALFAIEGELDDICAIGQTMAALDLCVGLRPSMKRYHLQTGVGHYGVFNGKRWAHEIYPRVRTMIHAHST